MSIYYTGIGNYRESGLYSEIEFLDIIGNWFLRRDWNDPRPVIQSLLTVLREFNPQRRIPEEFPLFTLDDWIEFSGAQRINN